MDLKKIQNKNRPNIRKVSTLNWPIGRFACIHRMKIGLQKVLTHTTIFTVSIRMDDQQSNDCVENYWNVEMEIPE